MNSCLAAGGDSMLSLIAMVGMMISHQQMAQETGAALAAPDSRLERLTN